MVGHDGMLAPSARSPAVNLVVYPYASDRAIELTFDQPETLAA